MFANGVAFFAGKEIKGFEVDDFWANALAESFEGLKEEGVNGFEMFGVGEVAPENVGELASVNEGLVVMSEFDVVFEDSKVFDEIAFPLPASLQLNVNLVEEVRDREFWASLGGGFSKEHWQGAINRGKEVQMPVAFTGLFTAKNDCLGLLDGRRHEAVLNCQDIAVVIALRFMRCFP